MKFLDYFTRSLLSEVEHAPRQLSRDDEQERDRVRYPELLAEIKKLLDELSRASFELARYQSTHQSSVSVHLGKVFVRVNGAHADPELDRLANHRALLLRRHSALLAEFARLKKDLGLAAY